MRPVVTGHREAWPVTLGGRRFGEVWVVRYGRADRPSSASFRQFDPQRHRAAHRLHPTTVLTTGRGDPGVVHLAYGRGRPERRGRTGDVEVDDIPSFKTLGLATRRERRLRSESPNPVFSQRMPFSRSTRVADMGSSTARYRNSSRSSFKAAAGHMVIRSSAGNRRLPG